MDVLKPQLVVANWKMNPSTRVQAQEYVADIKKTLGKRELAGNIVIASPFPFLGDVAKSIGKEKRVVLGAQNVSYEKMGAYTGEVSLSMLQDLGVSYVIIGHSERRALGERDEDVTKKAALITKSGVAAIVCVGERERDAHGTHFGTVEAQLRAAVKDVPIGKLASLVIAYEPVWAISTSTPGAHPATPEDAHEMILFIRKLLTDIYGRASAYKVRILYGGSVNQKNIESLVLQSGADGYLVGGASLKMNEFKTIVTTVYGR
ncbi:triose-phosphate isomerase [Patescibacteria group bacterium]|jgi:triosephosphate isomerase|nr:triose-phosphate isomerase [Patescibacteria group bacterium]